MTIVYFILDLYFAAILGVAGLSKVAQPSMFMHILQRHRILPLWSLSVVTRIVPWGEVTLAGTLVVGLFPRATDAFVLALLACFLMVEGILLATGRATECGCYGAMYRQKVDAASFTLSSILTALAGFHLWLGMNGATLDWHWRLVATGFAVGLGFWLLRHSMIHRRGTVGPRGRVEVDVVAFEDGDSRFQVVDERGQARNQGVPLAYLRKRLGGDVGELADPFGGHIYHRVSLKAWADADPHKTFICVRFRSPGNLAPYSPPPEEAEQAIEDAMARTS